MQMPPTHQLQHFLAIWPLDHPFFGDDCIHQISRSDIEYWIEDVHLRTHPLAAEIQQLAGFTLLQDVVFTDLSTHVDA